MTTRRSCRAAAAASLAALALATLVASPARATPVDIGMPVEGVSPSDLVDTFANARGKHRRHEAIDIMAPRGTPVLAASDGVVRRAYFHKLGGLCVYQDADDGRHAYLYGHLDRFAPGVKAGTVMRRGQVLGYVGTTGNAPPSAPHLHFAIYERTQPKPRSLGRPINPYPLLAGG